MSPEKILFVSIFIFAVCVPFAPGEEQVTPDSNNVREVKKGLWDPNWKFVLTIDELEELHLDKRLMIIRKAITNKNFLIPDGKNEGEQIGYWNASKGERMPFLVEELVIIEQAWARGEKFIELKAEDTGDVRAAKIQNAIDQVMRSK